MEKVNLSDKIKSEIVSNGRLERYHMLTDLARFH